MDSFDRRGRLPRGGMRRVLRAAPVANVGFLLAVGLCAIKDDAPIAGRSHREGVARAAGAVSPESPVELLFRLSGPNDGEPINSRSVELTLSTNYRDRGLVSIFVNDRYVASWSLRAVAVPDPESGLWVARIPIDLTDAARAAEDATRPGSAAVRVRVYLYSVQTSRLVTFDDWTARVERPSLEFPTRDGTLAGLTLPAGKVPVVAHLLEGDSYFFVLASTRKEILARSPQDPATLREARIVAGGSCPVETSPDRARGTRGAQRVVILEPGRLVDPEDVPLPQEDGEVSQPLIVLWTYDTARGWKRSIIEELPLR